MPSEDTQQSRVILHADDFGMNRCVTDGIVAGFANGLLTSTSVLSNAPDFDRALTKWMALDGDRVAGRLASASQRQSLNDRDETPFDLGVHLNLTQGRPLTATFPAELLDAEGRFPGIGRIFQRLAWEAGHWHKPIKLELSAQIERVIESGLRPTHLNGHQYVELVPGVAELISQLTKRYWINNVRVARERRVKLAFQGTPQPLLNGGLALVKRWFAGRFQRRMDQHGIHATDHFCGTAHAGRVRLDLLRQFVADLSQGKSIEIGLHPSSEPTAIDAQALSDGWHDPLADLRPQELAILQSPDLTKLLSSEKLCLGRIDCLSGGQQRIKHVLKVVSKRQSECSRVS